MMSIVSNLIQRQMKMQRGYLSEIKLNEMSKAAIILSGDLEDMYRISDDETPIFFSPNDIA